MSRIQIYGIVIAIVGFLLRYLMNRRKFNRNNQYGVQMWQSFEQKNTHLFFEKIVRIIGLLLILGGLVLVGVEVFNK